MPLVKQNNGWKFTSMMQGFEPIESEDFKGAFRAMFYYVKNALERGMSWQELETAIWIETPTNGAAPICFYDARDIACEAGWLVDGELTY
jgi:hypothetical protein